MTARSEDRRLRRFVVTPGSRPAPLSTPPASLVDGAGLCGVHQQHLTMMLKRIGQSWIVRLGRVIRRVQLPRSSPLARKENPADADVLNNGSCYRSIDAIDIAR